MRVRKSVIWHFLLEPLFFAQAVPSDIILYKKAGVNIMVNKLMFILPSSVNQALKKCFNGYQNWHIITVVLDWWHFYSFKVMLQEIWQQLLAFKETRLVLQFTIYNCLHGMTCTVLFVVFIFPFFFEDKEKWQE